MAKDKPEIGREQLRVLMELSKNLGVPLNQLTASKLFEGHSITELLSVTKDGDTLRVVAKVEFNIKG